MVGPVGVVELDESEQCRLVVEQLLEVAVQSVVKLALVALAAVEVVPCSATPHQR